MMVKKIFDCGCVWDVAMCDGVTFDADQLKVCEEHKGVD